LSKWRCAASSRTVLRGWRFIHPQLHVISPTKFVVITAIRTLLGAGFSR
jgi:hypothetical protein